MLKKLRTNKDKVIMIFIVFMLHVLLAFYKKGIYLSTDEMGVVATSAYFSGEDWSSIVKNIPYYGFGQSLIYIPIFKLTSNPQIRFIIMGIINSLILSFIPLILFEILNKFIGLNRKKSIVYSFIGGIFPGCMSFTKWIWNEVLLYILPILIIYIILLLLIDKKHKKFLSCLLAFLSVYSYSVHGRGIALICTVIFMLLYIKIIYKKDLVNYIYFTVSFGIFYSGYQFIKQLLLDNLWHIGKDEVIGNTLGSVINKMISSETILDILKTFFGHFYASILSSYGLLIIVMLYVIIYIYNVMKNKKYSTSAIKDINNYFNIVTIYSFISFFAALIIGVIFLSGQNGDYLIYTRYFSNMLLLPVLLGLILINEYGFLKKKLILVEFIFIVFSSLIFIILKDVGFSRPAVFFNIYPYLGGVEGKELIQANIIINIIFLLLMILSYIRKKIVYILVSIIFIHSYAYSAINIIIPSYTNTYNSIIEYSNIINSINGIEDKVDKIYYYDYKNYKPYTDSALQFQLPKFKIESLKGEIDDILNNISENSIIISTNDVFLENYDEKFQRLISDKLNKNHIYIWVYGKDLKEFIEKNSGYKFNDGKWKTIITNFDEFIVNNSKRIDNTICSDGSEGYILYGPYIKLFKGEYNLKIEGRLIKTGINKIGYIDIVSNNGEEIILPKTELSEFLDGDKINLNINFILEEDSELSEIRIFTNKDSIIKLDNIILQLN